MTKLEKSLIVLFRPLFSRDWLRRNEGQTLAEYALILALIAAVVVVVIAAFGDKLTQLFTDITSSV
jgi:Flp pilus assembly pilin Flp